MNHEADTSSPPPPNISFLLWFFYSPSPSFFLHCTHCRYDRISERAPDFLPEKAKGGKYVLGTLKMQRTTLVKAYLKWLDARAQEEKQKAKKQQRKASGGKKAAAAAATKKQEPAETAEPAAETDEETEVEEDEDDQPADQRLSLLSAVIGD